MTRINLIPVGELTDQHLLSEHREIKRIPNLIKSGKYSLDGIPNKFCLGKGHIKFFYNKIEFLFKRYIDLYNECNKRGFVIKNYTSNYHGIPLNLFNDYKPFLEDIELSRQRINEKLRSKPGFYRMNGKIIK